MEGDVASYCVEKDLGEDFWGECYESWRRHLGRRHGGLMGNGEID